MLKLFFRIKKKIQMSVVSWGIKYIRKKNEVAFQYISSDCFRYMGDASILSIATCYLTNRSFHWQVAFRLCKCTGRLRNIGYWLLSHDELRNAIQIPTDTSVGYGLYIGHGGPVVVNSSAIIGNNCNLSQFTTIGSNDGRAAIIGDNVYIGPGVCIIENVAIGNDVTIGGGVLSQRIYQKKQLPLETMRKS